MVERKPGQPIWVTESGRGERAVIEFIKIDHRNEQCRLQIVEQPPLIIPEPTSDIALTECPLIGPLTRHLTLEVGETIELEGVPARIKLVRIKQYGNAATLRIEAPERIRMRWDRYPQT